MVQYIGRLRATSMLPYRSISKTRFFNVGDEEGFHYCGIYSYFLEDRNYGFEVPLISYAD